MFSHFVFNIFILLVNICHQGQNEGRQEELPPEDLLTGARHYAHIQPSTEVSAKVAFLKPASKLNTQDSLL